MSGAALFQLVALVVALAVTAPPLGRYLAAVYGSARNATARRVPGDRVFAPIERVVYRVLRVDPEREQRWNVYAISLLAFSLFSFLAVYVLQRVQEHAALQPHRRGRRGARSAPSTWPSAS